MRGWAIRIIIHEGSLIHNTCLIHNKSKTYLYIATYAMSETLKGVKNIFYQNIYWYIEESYSIIFGSIILFGLSSYSCQICPKAKC